MLAKEDQDEKESQSFTDFEIARRAQKLLDARIAHEQIAIIKADERVAQKLGIKIAREDHRRDKKLELLHSDKDFTNLQCVRSTWETAEAVVDDVPGGICITVTLPFMEKIDLVVSGRKRNKLELDVRRFARKLFIENIN